MRRTLTAAHERFALHTPFRISRGTKTAADVVTVTVREGDAVGRGEGVPYPRYGESVEGVLAAIESVRGAVEEGARREALLALLPAGAARNAVDCALWDLEARLSGRSVAAMISPSVRPERSRRAWPGETDVPRLRSERCFDYAQHERKLGQSTGTFFEPDRIASALTIVIDAPEAMAVAAARVAGAPVLKVKVDASDPAGQVRAVRGAAPEAALIVDPNESWDAAVAAGMRGVLVEARVALLEQPAPAGDDAWLQGFDAGAPVCADESVHTAADLDRLGGRYDVVNIKLDKTGGLTAALELARAARTRGLGVMTGCMVSTSLSIAPALHVAGMSDFADLDGPLWLREDRAGGVRDDGGMLAPPSPGFWGEP